MGILRKKAKAATASIADDENIHAHDDMQDEIALLEAITNADPSCAAAEQYAAFRLTPGAQSLLDRALDNMATNTGANLPTELADLKKATHARAELVDASGNDLTVMIDAIVLSTEDPKRIAPAIHSLCFNVLKSATFFANLDYRRYLDPRGDFDLTTYTGVSAHGENGDAERTALDFARDAREEEPSAPYGLDTIVDRELQHWQQLYGADCRFEDEIIPAALKDLRIFLTLAVEAFGWDFNGLPMPFAFIREKDETYTPVTDVYEALDVQEIKRKESQARRNAEQAVQMLSAAEKARAIVASRLRR